MPNTKSKVCPVRLTQALDEKVEEAARQSGLKKQDVMRLSLERGIEVLLAQLTSAPARPETEA